MTKHTPGEWKFDGTWGLIHGPKGEEICAIHAGVDPNEKRPPKDVAKANAALIASAPDLFEVVRLAADSQSWDGNNPNDDRWTMLYAMARAALKKAGGE